MTKLQIIASSASILGVVLQLVGAYRMSGTFASTYTAPAFFQEMFKPWRYLFWTKSIEGQLRTRTRLEDLNVGLDQRARSLSGLFCLGLGCLLQCVGVILPAVPSMPRLGP